MTPAPFFVWSSILSIAMSSAVPREPSPSPASAPSTPDAREQPRDLSHASPLESPANPEPQNVLLREDTPVKLKLLHRLNSKTVVVDDPPNFAVAEDAQHASM